MRSEGAVRLSRLTAGGSTSSSSVSLPDLTFTLMLAEPRMVTSVREISVSTSASNLASTRSGTVAEATRLGGASAYLKVWAMVRSIERRKKGGSWFSPTRVRFSSSKGESDSSSVASSATMPRCRCTSRARSSGIGIGTSPFRSERS